MSKNSIRQTVAAQSDWRETLQHIKDVDSFNLKYQVQLVLPHDKKVNIKK